MKNLKLNIFFFEVTSSQHIPGFQASHPWVKIQRLAQLSSINFQ
jgi:hypothetical protein